MNLQFKVRRPLGQSSQSPADVMAQFANGGHGDPGKKSMVYHQVMVMFMVFLKMVMYSRWWLSHPSEKI